MAEPILLQEMRDGSLRWLDLDAVEKSLSVGSLTECAGLFQGRQVLLVWPAQDVFLIELELPLRNASQIAKALPFALEDHLAEDLERYHLVWHRIPRSSRIAVAAVGHEVLTACRQRFAEAGVALSMLLPEPLLLPWRSGDCVMLLMDDYCIFRQGAWAGGGGEQSLLKLIQEKLYQSVQDEGHVQLYSAADVLIDEMAFTLPDDDVSKIEPLLLYAGQCQSAAQLNLLCGPYAVKVETEGNARPWWLAAAVFMLALLLQLLGQWQAVSQQERQLAAVEEKNESLFRQTFPDIKRLVNLKVQANQTLQDMQKQTPSQSGFLSLLYRVGELLKDDAQISLQGLHFADDSLLIRLRGQDSASLQAFSSRLASAAELHTESHNVTAVKNGMEVELVVRQN